MTTLDARVRTPMSTEFDQLSKKVIATIVTTGIFTVGGAGLIVWATTREHTMRIDTIEKRLDQSDERERKIADRLSELGTDVRWIRRELEKQSSPAR